MQYVFLIRSRAGGKKYVTRLRLVTYFLPPALERIKNTYCMGQRPFLYLYCTVVSHACIHAPLVRSQAKPKIVRSYRQHGNVTEYGKPLNPTLDLQVALFASSKNTRCAASDVNPFKIRFNLQITKATVNETQ